MSQIERTPTTEGGREDGNNTTAESEIADDSQDARPLRTFTAGQRDVLLGLVGLADRDDTPPCAADVHRFLRDAHGRSSSNPTGSATVHDALAQYRREGYVTREPNVLRPGQYDLFATAAGKQAAAEFLDWQRGLAVGGEESEYSAVESGRGGREGSS